MDYFYVVMMQYRLRHSVQTAIIDELHSKFQMSRELDEFGPQNYALFSMRLYQGVMPHFSFP